MLSRGPLGGERSSQNFRLGELRRTPSFETSENFPSGDRPKRVGGACGVALRSTSTALFDPFWPSYASQFRAQSVVCTPFRTVSKRTRAMHATGLREPPSEYKLWRLASGASRGR